MESISSISEHGEYRRFSSISNSMFGSTPGNSSNVVRIINLKNIINLQPKRTKRKRKEDFLIFDKLSESLEHYSSFHRDRSVQRLADASTCVSTLIDDSDDSEDDLYYESSDDMTSSIASFELDGRYQESPYLWPISPEEGVKLSKFKQQGCVSPEKMFSESFCSIDDPSYEQELQPIGSSKGNTAYEKTLT